MAANAAPQTLAARTREGLGHGERGSAATAPQVTGHRLPLASPGAAKPGLGLPLEKVPVTPEPCRAPRRPHSAQRERLPPVGEEAPVGVAGAVAARSGAGGPLTPRRLPE